MGGTQIEALRRLGIEVTACLGCSSEATQSGVRWYGLEHGYAGVEELVSEPG
jgi:hypothetical protein